MYSDFKLDTALTRCFYCGKHDRILINKRLTRHGSPKLKELHDKVIDMEPCNQCKKLMNSGIILIGFDPDKSSPGWQTSERPNPYRTGQFFVVTDDFLERNFGPLDPKSVKSAIKHRFAFMDEAVIDRILKDYEELHGQAPAELSE